MKTDNPYNPVNLKEIDDQHVKIINCIEELEHLSEAGQKKHLVIPMIDELVSSCIINFSSEENLMRKFKYEIFSHKYEHDRCIRKIKEYGNRYEDNEEILSELLSFIKNWMRNHIEMKDKHLAEFLNNLFLK